MAIVSNTFLTYSAKGIREDLSNVITNISPEETPYMSNIGRENVSNSLFEYQTDTLAAAATNAQLEGDDVASFDAVTATVRLQNYAQISRKTIILSATEEVVNKAGRRSELAYQIAKRGAEMKRDQEFSMLNGAIAVAGDSTTARATASLGAFVKTNTDKQTNGVDPSYTTLPNSARTDGNVRTFTETILKNVIQKVWTAGGTPKILMCGPVNKQRVSSFAGIASSRFNIDGGAKPATLVGAVDIYVSDFGNVQVIANRFQRERDAWVIDPDYAKMTVLRPYQQIELAKTGDAEKRMLIVEWGHKVSQENCPRPGRRLGYFLNQTGKGQGNLALFFMIEKKLFDVNAQQGITRHWHYNTDTDEVTIQTQQDVTDVIEANKAIYNSVDEKANWTGEWHLVASIPEALYYKMKAEGKIDDQEYMKRWLNDSENQFFRTRPGKV
jgi:hypothetical protein